MRVLLVGATGVVGRPLVPRLVAAGHEVVATSRHVPEEAGASLPGVTYRQLDLLDRRAVTALVGELARRRSCTRPRR